MPGYQQNTIEAIESCGDDVIWHYQPGDGHE